MTQSHSIAEILSPHGMSGLGRIGDSLCWGAGLEIDEHADVLTIDIEREVTECCAFLDRCQTIPRAGQREHEKDGVQPALFVDEK
jgi:hypothetical protein